MRALGEALRETAGEPSSEDERRAREELLALVESSYSEPTRAYHDLTHIEELVEWFRRVRDEGPGWERPLEVLLAITFHDAVYVVGRSDNEARSAELARDALSGRPNAFGRDGSARPLRAEYVVELIEATAEHGKHAMPDQHASGDRAHFLDADLAILGAPPTRYEAYEAAIRSEYAAVPDALFEAGRRRFLERLLASPRIFSTAFFSERLETAARENISRALGDLGSR